MSKLSADYDGKTILNDINLTVDGDELLVVLDPSGWEETTLLNFVAGCTSYHAACKRVTAFTARRVLWCAGCFPREHMQMLLLKLWHESRRKRLTLYWRALSHSV
ncbi:hypothetical protein FH968_22375 [Buttiauxella sp. B2]|uniref:hypothetical protein n=1 Tax=Buttiauxella sp. B2 TaxID=2587812 RepID=UPI0011222B6B|nr:hypothetical protein FH968_22375 [Buttiauxella sp. B2]